MTVRSSWLRAFGPFLLAVSLAWGTPARASTPAYTSSITITPSRGLLSRTIQIRPDKVQCWAIAQVRHDLHNVPCYDVVTLQLSSGQTIRGWTERYASIRQCLARLTPTQLQSRCARTIAACVNAHPSSCPPAWTSQTSIGFRTNGRAVRESWITCGMGTFSRFRYHLNWCGTTRGDPPFQRRWLSAGDNYEVSIPRVTQVGTEERILLSPNGTLQYTACC